MPKEASLTLALDGPSRPSAQVALFALADARTPGPSPFVARAAADGTLTLEGPALYAVTVRDAWFIPDGAGAIVNPAPQRVTVADGRLTLALTPGPGWATPLTGVAVLRDAGGQQCAWAVTAGGRSGDDVIDADGPAGGAGRTDPEFDAMRISRVGDEGDGRRPPARPAPPAALYGGRG